MSEINKALGASGVGHTITLALEGEEQLKDEIANLEATPAPLPENFQKDLEAKKKQLAELEAQPHQSLTFMPLTKRKQAKYEEFMESRARDTAITSRRQLLAHAKQLRKKALLSQNEELQAEANQEAYGLEQEAVSKLKNLDVAIAAGEYSFVSEHCGQFTRTLFGQAYMVKLMLEDSHPTMTDIQVQDLLRDHYDEVTQAVGAALDLGK